MVKRFRCAYRLNLRVAAEERRRYNKLVQTASISQQEFLQNIRSLFWWIKDEDLPSLDSNAVVEAVLNYGSLKETKQLFELYGIEKVAAIFKSNAFRQRSNYYPKVKNYFDLYFKYHVPTYTQ